MSDNLGSAYNPKKLAVNSQTEELFVKRSWTGKKKTCWKCQKDKTTYGGHQKILAGFYKFVCKDCLDLKNQEKKDVA